VASRLDWYRSRFGAMTPAERLWRVGAPALAATDRFRRRPSRVDFVAGAWPAALPALVAELSAFDDATRIAQGELSLWGQRVSVSPRSPAWDADPFTGAHVEWRRRMSDTDPKHVWELHRHQHLLPLAVAGDPGGIAAAQLDAWLARNPRRAGGPAWSSGYETAHRLVGWAWTVPLLASQLDPELLAALATSYADQARFVDARPSRFSSANNHRLAEVVGLLYAAALSGEPAWWRRLSEELDREAAAQTFPDGGSREQAAGYFLYVLEMLWAAGLLRVVMGDPLARLGEVVERMVGWACAVGDEALEPPAFGDDAEDRILRLEYFEPRRARTIAGRARALLDGQVSLEAAALSPSSESVVLESGLAVLRRGSTRVTFDLGELGFGPLAAHGHADALAVLVARGDRTLLRDSGTGSYLEREGRQQLRVTAAHNTVEVASASQAVALGPHLWGERFSVQVEHVALTDAFDYVRGRHDGYLHRFGAVHRRSVLLLGPELLVVIDDVEAPDELGVRLHWHLEGEADLHVASSPETVRDDEPYRWSPRYGTWVTGTRAAWYTRATHVRFATVLGEVAIVELDGHVVKIRLQDGSAITVVERFSGDPEVVR